MRERVGDIPALVDHFARRIGAQNGWKPKPFDADSLAALARHNWPGDFRELRNAVERLLLLSDDVVDTAAVRLALPGAFNMSDTAKALGLERSHLYKKCGQLGIHLQTLRKA